MGHGLKAEGKEELSEEGRGGGLSLLEGQGRRSMVPWRNSHSEAEVEGGWKWEARKDFHGRRTAALRSGEATKVSGLGRVSGQGQAGKHSPASHCSSRAGTSHRSAPGTRRLAVGRRGVRPGCWVLPARPPAAWGYLGRHVHEQHGGDGRLGLAVAFLGSVKRVGFQHPEQVLLAAERRVGKG